MLLVSEYWKRNEAWQEYYFFVLRVQPKLYNTHFEIFKNMNKLKVEKMVIHLSSN
jgi:hypothetical protein